MKSSFEEKLYNKALENNIELSEDKLNLLFEYQKLLLEWNQKINLTAITQEDDIILKHFVDCLECTKYIKEGSNIIDVGTGAGFPGLVLAIFFSDKVNITLIDALNKRLIFLDEVVKKLNLKNINILHSRAEDGANNVLYREKYDIATARAVATLPILIEYLSPYVKVNGKCLIMKSGNIANELKESSNALNKLNCKIANIYEYKLKSNQEEYLRTIIEISKNNNTPKGYPRNYGKIKKGHI